MLWRVKKPLANICHPAEGLINYYFVIKQYELAERIDETKDRLEKGDVTGEALAIELSAKWAVSIRTAHRYIAYAKDIMDDNLKRRESILQEMRLEVIGEDIRNGILSNLELEAKLCAIIEGKLLAEDSAQPRGRLRTHNLPAQPPRYYICYR